MWRHICVEGICFAEEPPPCGQKTVSTLCLENGHCPHFAYADSNEREAAFFVPLYLIIWDKAKSLCVETIYEKLHWYFWGRWFFEKDWAEIKQYMKEHTAECPAWDEQLEKSKEDFPKWFEKAKEKQ